VSLDLAALRADLCDAFDQIDGVTFIPRKVGSIQPPCAWIEQVDMTPESFGDGCYTFTLLIHFAVSSAEVDGALEELEAFLDSNVLAHALDPVGGINRYTDVGGTVLDGAGNEYIGFTVEVEVIR
jgi:hypothetical protein